MKKLLAVVLVLCVAMGGFAALAQGPEYEMISRTREYLADGHAGDGDAVCQHGAHAGRQLSNKRP